MKAEEFFRKEWGSGFVKATLQERNGLLHLSMSDIYETMEKFAKHKLQKETKNK